MLGKISERRLVRSPVIKQIKERILTRENLMELAGMVNEEMDTTMKSHQNELKLISEAIAVKNSATCLYWQTQKPPGVIFKDCLSFIVSYVHCFYCVYCLSVTSVAKLSVTKWHIGGK